MLNAANRFKHEIKCINIFEHSWQVYKWEFLIFFFVASNWRLLLNLLRLLRVALKPWIRFNPKSSGEAGKKLQPKFLNMLQILWPFYELFTEGRGWALLPSENFHSGPEIISEIQWCLRKCAHHLSSVIFFLLFVLDKIRFVVSSRLQSGKGCLLLITK